MFHVEHHKIDRQKVSRETFTSVDQIIEENKKHLTTYLDQLLWWNQKVNLVSRNVPRETVWQHIRHSLLLSQLQVYIDADFIVDSGTGGGLPGIPLAICAPGKQFLLNDIVTKKITAVRQILLKLSLSNAEAESITVKNLEIPASSLLISKHAFKINELWEMVKDKPWKSLVFYKGIEFEEELDNIETPLDIQCFDLSAGAAFYDGKAIIVIKRFDN